MNNHHDTYTIAAWSSKLQTSFRAGRSNLQLFRRVEVLVYLSGIRAYVCSRPVEKNLEERIHFLFVIVSLPCLSTMCGWPEMIMLPNIIDRFHDDAFCIYHCSTAITANVFPISKRHKEELKVQNLGLVCGLYWRCNLRHYIDQQNPVHSRGSKDRGGLITWMIDWLFEWLI